MKWFFSIAIVICLVLKRMGIYATIEDKRETIMKGPIHISTAQLQVSIIQPIDQISRGAGRGYGALLSSQKMLIFYHTIRVASEPFLWLKNRHVLKAKTQYFFQVKEKLSNFATKPFEVENRPLKEVPFLIWKAFALI